MKIIYLGTPNFAVQPLNALMKAGHEIVAVVTKIDKVNARGNKIVATPVKAFALENNLSLYQFKNINLEGLDVLKELNADIMVTASYGQILKKDILEMCKLGVVNIHGSILPKYRGASPVGSALINGETKTGITIVQTGIGLDDGEMLAKAEMDIDYMDNQETLMDKLSNLGAETIVKVLENFDYYKANQEVQDDSQSTHCAKFTKEEAKLDFTLDAEVLRNKVRGYYGNPTAHFEYDNVIYKIFEAEVVTDFSGEAGQILSCDKVNGFVIACGTNALKITRLQKQGGKVMNFKDFVNGNKIPLGKVNFN